MDISLGCLLFSEGNWRSSESGGEERKGGLEGVEKRDNDQDILYEKKVNKRNKEN